MLLWRSDKDKQNEDENSIILNFNLGDEQHTYYEVFAAINAGLWEWNRLHFYDRGYIDAAKNVPHPSVGECTDPIAVYWNMERIGFCENDVTSFVKCGIYGSDSTNADLNAYVNKINEKNVLIKLYFSQIGVYKTNEITRKEECGIDLMYKMYAGVHKS
jgi:hypothetical protein